LHPFRPMRWTILFVEEFLIYSIWITLHRERSVAQMRQKHGRNSDVIVDHLPLGEVDLRIKNFVQVRDRECFSFDDELCFFRHLTNVQRSTINRKLLGHASSAIVVLREDCFSGTLKPTRETRALPGSVRSSWFERTVKVRDCETRAPPSSIALAPSPTQRIVPASAVVAVYKWAPRNVPKSRGRSKFRFLPVGKRSGHRSLAATGIAPRPSRL